jgi:hypothetical protein
LVPLPGNNKITKNLTGVNILLVNKMWQGIYDHIGEELNFKLLKDYEYHYLFKVIYIFNGQTQSSSASSKTESPPQSIYATSPINSSAAKCNY